MFLIAKGQEFQKKITYFAWYFLAYLIKNFNIWNSVSLINPVKGEVRDEHLGIYNCC